MQKRISRNRFSCFLVLSFFTLVVSCGEEQGVPDKVNFSEHVAPLLFQNCTYCHRTGGSAHFALENYQQAKAYASAIAFVTKERMMPPWPADPHYTEFAGQRVLTEKEIEIFQRWVKQGSPEGPQDKLPPLPDYPSGSMIGIPDIRLPVPPVTLPANSSDRFLLVKVPFELPANSYASVIEFVPGHNNVVHHVNGDMVIYEPGK